jgi:hypothetical protein
MCDPHVSENGVQVADAAFEPAETGGGFATAHIEAAQIARAVFARTGTEGKTRRRT